jgi:FkbM family methyltransferase
VAASHIDCAPIVYAFEMRPACLDTMRTALARDRLDGRVFIHAAALSDRHEGDRDIWWCGTKAFEQEPAKHEWQPPLWHRIKLAINGEWRVPRKTHVALTSIDHFVTENGAAPDLIKIDVDGYEGKVLRGGLATFRTYKPAIALELHKDKLIRFGDTRPAIIKMLIDLGYRAYFLTDHQDRKVCRVVPVDAGHLLVARQETDFIVLWPS